MQKSYFDGGMLTYILSYIISFFIITLTFGLGTPWAICIMYKWEITLGIYGFWIHIKVLEWKAEHTYFLD